MSFTLDVYYWGQGGQRNPAVARSADELDRVLQDIGASEQPHSPVFVAQERPKWGRHQMDDHQVKIDVDTVRSLGAICFYGPHPEVPAGFEVAAWVSKTDAVLADAPTFYLDKATRTEFPADAVIPLSLVHQALQEFRVTGERPTCIDWQPSATW